MQEALQQTLQGQSDVKAKHPYRISSLRMQIW